MKPVPFRNRFQIQHRPRARKVCGLCGLLSRTRARVFELFGVVRLLRAPVSVSVAGPISTIEKRACSRAGAPMSVQSVQCAFAGERRSLSRETPAICEQP